MDNMLTEYDPDVPDELKYEDCLKCPGKKGGTVFFHKPTGYFYWKVVDPRSNFVSHLCACWQFMSENHTKYCSNKGKDFVMTEKCRTFIGSGGRHSHPPPSRFNMELMVFKWEAQLTQILKAKTVNDIWIINNMYQTWPFALVFTKPRLKNLLRISLNHARRIGLAKPGSKDNQDCQIFIDQFDLDKVKAMKSLLLTSVKYWGPPLPLDNRTRKVKCFECCKETLNVTKRNHSNSLDDDSPLILKGGKRKCRIIVDSDSESSSVTLRKENVNNDPSSNDGLRNVPRKRLQPKESSFVMEKSLPPKVRDGRSAKTSPFRSGTGCGKSSAICYLEIPDSFWVKIASLEQ